MFHKRKCQSGEYDEYENYSSALVLLKVLAKKQIVL